MSAPRTSSRSSVGRANRFQNVVFALLALDCVGVFAIWMASLSEGAFEEGLLTYQLQGTVPAYHLVAEATMASVTLLGLGAHWAGRRWGNGVLLLGLGMMSYAAVNSLGWALHNDPWTAVPMIATLALTLLALPFLLHLGPLGTRRRVEEGREGS